jgi:LCP family protein required for cell wall assembly
MLGRVFSSGELGLVSIPRDSWVQIPGRGQGKINAAFSYGGPRLLVETIEAETNVRVDHFAMIDFDGLVAVTDAIGGVTLDSPRASSYDGHHFVKGENVLDGAEALAFVRQRKGLPRGDLDRVENQQRFLRAMFGQAVSRSVASSPERLDAVLDAVLDHVQVDDRTSADDLRLLARALGGTPSASVVAGTAPVSGLGYEGRQSVVHLDPVRTRATWRALQGDDVHALREALTSQPR